MRRNDTRAVRRLFTEGGPCADLAFNPRKGEPYRLALVAADDRVAVVIVPDPITGRHTGCTLSVERLLPRFELAYFRTGCHRSANANHKQFELDSAHNRILESLVRLHIGIGQAPKQQFGHSIYTVVINNPAAMWSGPVFAR